MMPRPRKHDGEQWPDNLYADNRKRPNHYRYKNANGNFKPLKGDFETVCIIANEANRLRGTKLNTQKVGSFTWWLPQYIDWKESANPLLADKPSWLNRKNLLTSFCDAFDYINPKALKLSDLEPWWDALTYDQQHNRRSAFSYFFQWLLGKDAVNLNPFTTADDRPRVFEKAKPKRKRMRLDFGGYWAIYNAAGELGLEFVQVAMGISILTSMREGDICSLRFDANIVDNHLCKTISKSEQQRGESAASHLSWDLDLHGQLKKIIKRARELSLKNLRCPYVVSHAPKQRRIGKTKDHYSQVTTKRLIDGFAAARDHCGMSANIPKGFTPTTFHEVRALCLKCGKDNHYDIKDLSELAAHGDIKVTESYIAGHTPVFKEIGVVFNEKMLGGNFGK